jgi:GNAT superfamily N-acetyltransferase
MELTVLPVTQVDFTAYVRAFNDAYKGYLVPIHLTTEQMRLSIAQNQIDLEASRVILDGEQIVGVGSLAIRGELGWVGGVGVAPSHRRKGIGRQLMHTLFDAARDRGLSHIQLEVITSNTAAHALYVDLGFASLQDLLVIECDGPPRFDPDPSFAFKDIPTPEALDYYADFHDTPIPWQRQQASMQAMTQLTAWAVWREGVFSAYATGIMAPGQVYLVDVAFDTGEEAALGHLLAYIHNQRPEVPARLINLGAGDPAWPILRALGFVETLRQYEMHLDL